MSKRKPKYDCMKPIELTIATVPTAQPRQRHRVINSGERTFATNYTPAKHPVQQFKNDVRTAWMEESKKCEPSRTIAFGDSPISCEMLFVFPRPASKTRKRGDNPRLLHTTKPDAENVAKAVLDALSGYAFNDDKQVCNLVILKRIAAAGEIPHVVLRVSTAVGENF